MIIFYSKSAEDIVLAGILRHYNPQSMLRMYDSNEDILKIAKMHDEKNFIRVKDYNLSILNQYRFPEWIKDDSKMRLIELIIANKSTNTISLINHIANHLFEPEKLFYGALDKTVMFKDFAMQVINELRIFSRFNKTFEKNGIIYYEINPENDIIELYAKNKAKENNEGFVVLNNNSALVYNAKKLGFSENSIYLTKYEALSLKKQIFVNPASKNEVKKTVATKISEYQ